LRLANGDLGMFRSRVAIPAGEHIQDNKA